MRAIFTINVNYWKWPHDQHELLKQLTHTVKNIENELEQTVCYTDLFSAIAILIYLSSYNNAILDELNVFAI